MMTPYYDLDDDWYWVWAEMLEDEWREMPYEDWYWAEMPSGMHVRRPLWASRAELDESLREQELRYLVDLGGYSAPHSFHEVWIAISEASEAGHAKDLLSESEAEAQVQAQDCELAYLASQYDDNKRSSPSEKLMGNNGGYERDLAPGGSLAGTKRPRSVREHRLHPKGKGEHTLPSEGSVAKRKRGLTCIYCRRARATRVCHRSLWPPVPEHVDVANAREDAVYFSLDHQFREKTVMKIVLEYAFGAYYLDNYRAHRLDLLKRWRLGLLKNKSRFEENMALQSKSWGARACSVGSVRSLLACRRCKTKNECSVCGRWECEDCLRDNWVTPLTVYQACMKGERWDTCPYKALDLRNIRGVRVCQYCRVEMNPSKTAPLRIGE
uniref:Uncharacterized protein n=1 Tax=Lotharella globosa TaxID=91324 RepID=A0A7S3ZA04_9EUKA